MPSKKQRKPVDLAAFEREYQGIAAILPNFCQELTAQLNTLLTEADVVLGFPIQYRVKRWESIAEKLEQGGLDIASVQEMQDLAGLRLILLYKRDVETVCELIVKHFTLIRQYDTQDRLKADQFGYASRHLIVELPEGWLAVPTLKGMGGLQAEIQVRTVAQHIWAEISHKLQYKHEASVPPTLRRAIYRASALLETVDLEFERVLTERASYRADIDVTEDEVLNVDVLEKILDDLFPEKNKDPNENYAELLDDLTHYQVATVTELRNLINKHYTSIMENETARAQEAIQEYRDGNLGEDPERTERGVYFTHVGLARTALKVEHGEKDFMAWIMRKMPQRSSPPIQEQEADK